MKHEEFNPVLFEEAYDALLERQSEYEEGCRKQRSKTDAQRKAAEAGKAPDRQPQPQRPQQPKKPQQKRKKKCAPTAPTYAEALDFARCQRPDGTFYGTGGTCRKGTPVGAKEKDEKKAKGEDAMRARFKDSKKELGEGSYGAVKETADGNVIKKGYLGAEEVSIMEALADVEGTPKLIDHAYTSAPFADRDNDRMGMIEMSKVKGKPILSVEDQLSPKQAQQASEEFIRLRRDMHTRGVEHRDMHLMNFFFDPETNKGGVLDFGMSRRSSKGALEEALETGRGNGEQLYFGPLIDKGGSGARYTRFKQNRIAVNKELKARGYNPREVLKGMKPKEAKELLAKLYDGV